MIMRGHSVEVCNAAGQPMAIGVVTRIWSNPTMGERWAEVAMHGRRWAGPITLLRRIAVLALAITTACVADAGRRRPCEQLPHHDTTGHVVLCDCSCPEDPRFACPPMVRECIDPELVDDDWRWPTSDGSSGEEGST